MVELAQTSTRGEGPGNEHTDLIIERRGEGKSSVTVKWNISSFSNKQKVLYSKYFEVGGYDCRLLVYPSGEKSVLSIFRAENHASMLQISNQHNNQPTRRCNSFTPIPVIISATHPSCWDDCHSLEFSLKPWYFFFPFSPQAMPKRCQAT